MFGLLDCFGGRDSNAKKSPKNIKQITDKKESNKSSNDHEEYINMEESTYSYRQY